MAGGSKSYWEMSCPKCGKPSTHSPDMAINKVQPNAKGKVPRKVRCTICKSSLITEIIRGYSYILKDKKC